MNEDQKTHEGIFGPTIIHTTQDTLVDGPNTPGQPRQTAYAGDGLWIGQCEVTARDIPSQWHHHKYYDSIMYMLEGRIRVDWGENGEKSFEMGPGDYGFFGRKVIHRAQIIDTPENCRYVFVRLGEGESVENVAGPGFAGE
ncbi:cupin domain-containing protein [Aliiroseovarius lamellibrachiae]|uniref:cupin domain-containing protein n=1 Tax=Aliiroseovarius lamellibrachiae TaxID=1924933 RepID=UPI001BE0DF60|nr:cupin domain-containing protein [Aliiroseovarius lamellibrachiae]MBT2132344.1 cupin domain-containing protein [Aliiroseovarius lamellibrachiae]